MARLRMREVSIKRILGATPAPFKCVKVLCPLKESKGSLAVFAELDSFRAVKP